MKRHPEPVSTCPSLDCHVPAAPRLILASGSPRRKALLGELGLPFQIVVSNEAEDVEPGRNPVDHAVQIAERKARAVANGLTDALILGADSIVVLDDALLGKPADDDEAMEMLRRLSGCTHKVITGVSLVDVATDEARNAIVVSSVRVRSLSDEEIAAYVATGEPRDKAGAYAIQGVGGKLIARLDGCFNNVVGLPLCAVATLLGEAGLAIPVTWDGCRLPNESLCPHSV